MSEAEQEEHLGRLLVKVRKLRKTRACLESKILDICRPLKQTLGLDDSRYGIDPENFAAKRKEFEDAGGADLARRLEEYEDTIQLITELDRQIKAIDG